MTSRAQMEKIINQSFHNTAGIIVLKGGEIAERGTHAALIEQQGLYASMWNRQREATQAEEHLRQVREADELGVVVRKPPAS